MSSGIRAPLDRSPTGARPLDSRGQEARPPRVRKDPPPRLAASPAVEALRAELADLADGERRLCCERFWSQVQAAGGTPLIERPWPDAPDERAVTFLYRERPAGARMSAVTLIANKLTDPTLRELAELEHLEGSDVWHRSYRLPADYHGTYQLSPDDGSTRTIADGPQHGPRSRWAEIASTAMPDPLCPRTLAGKAGEPALSVCSLDAAPPQPWRDRRVDVPRGGLTEWRWRERACWSYLPAPELAGDVEHDLLVVLDGEDWAHRLDLPTTLDNLLADGRTAPIAAVMVDAVDLTSRWRDLTCDPDFAAAIAGDLLAEARRRLPVGPGPERTTITGRSLGGLTALFIAERHPGRFGTVHAQSPSLWWPHEDSGAYAAGWLGRALAAADRPAAARVSIDVGSEEWLLLDPARELADALRGRGDVDVVLREYAGGHDSWCWRGTLADALAAQHAARRERER